MSGKPGRSGRPRQPVLLVAEEPFQWHLNTSRYDWCPNCRGEVAFLKQRVRACVSFSADACKDGFTRTLSAEPEYWLKTLGFSPEEIAELMRKQQGSGTRRRRWVTPGFLGVEEKEAAK